MDPVTNLANILKDYGFVGVSAFLGTGCVILLRKIFSMYDDISNLRDSFHKEVVDLAKNFQDTVNTLMRLKGGN